MTIDPDLPGIWIIPGEPATYEVAPDGGYHIAEPSAPISIHRGGQAMTWDGVEFDSVLGADASVEGVWRNRATLDEWYFRPDGSYTLHWTDGEEAHGIWSAQDEGATLWAREHLGRIETNGAEVTFILADGPPARYGYTVGRESWTLMDPQSWKVLIEYKRA